MYSAQIEEWSLRIPESAKADAFVDKITTLAVYELMLKNKYCRLSYNKKVLVSVIHP
jgi:hypothetical protein